MSIFVSKLYFFFSGIPANAMISEMISGYHLSLIVNTIFPRVITFMLILYGQWLCTVLFVISLTLHPFYPQTFEAYALSQHKK